jgi:hypothetical protein
MVDKLGFKRFKYLFKKYNPTLDKETKKVFKKYLGYNRHGCGPGEVFDYKTDQCKRKTVVFVEAYVRRHDVKVLDNRGVVVDIPFSDAADVGEFLVSGVTSKQIDKEYIDMMDMALPMNLFHSFVEKFYKQIGRDLSELQKNP